MSKITLYHGSNKIVSQPVFGEGKVYNDYGRGFYCTEHLELAKEWTCPVMEDGFANGYELDTRNLRVLDLQASEYCTLHWLALLVNNRRFDLSTPIMRQGFYHLTQNFMIDVSSYDLIKGYRADDSYFSFAEAFLSNQISYKQLQEAMKLGKLGEQIVLKSKKAFKAITFTGYEIAEGSKYCALRKMRLEKAKEEYKNVIGKLDLKGLYIRDLIVEDIKNDDPRLR